MKVVLLAASPRSTPELSLDNYGVHRVAASLEADPSFEGEVHVVEVEQDQTHEAVLRAEEIDPDVVGVSAFVWSLPTLYPAARELKLRQPRRSLVIGGPSARPEMFDRAPWNDAMEFVDALVLGNSEWTIRELVRTERADYGRVAGLALPGRRGFERTAPRIGDPTLDHIPSPYQSHRLEPKFPVLQTYFGCPFTCAFCAWGAMGNAKDVLSVDYLVRELSVWKEGRAEGALMSDAGLNLNEHAFRNLAAAEAQVGFFAKHTLLCELYPNRVTPHHLEFLAGVHQPQVSVGLQSYDPEVLERVRRSFDEHKFHTVLEDLHQVSEVVIEIICGLPGDRPESFRRTFDRVRALPYGCRVYPCLVLPDALMNDRDARQHTTWDPVTLKVRSTWGWTERELAETQAYVEEACKEANGYPAEYWWSFDKRVRPSGPRFVPIGGAVGDRLTAAVSQATLGHWHVTSVGRRGAALHLGVQSGASTFAVWCEIARADSRYFRIVGDLGFGFENDTTPRTELANFERSFAAIGGAFRAASSATS